LFYITSGMCDKTVTCKQW